MEFLCCYGVVRLKNLLNNKEVSITNKFQDLFSKEDFTKTIPFNYDVDWKNPVKQYSEEINYLDASIRGIK